MIVLDRFSRSHQGLALLRTRRFERSTGFNGTGTLRHALNATLSTLPAEVRHEMLKSQGMVDDCWDFVCGDADQGFFATMCVRECA